MAEQTGLSSIAEDPGKELGEISVVSCYSFTITKYQTELSYKR